MGKGSRGSVSWKRERQRKVKETMKRKFGDQMKKWKDRDEKRKNETHSLKRLDEIMRKMVHDRYYFVEERGWKNLAVEERFLVTGEGREALRILGSLSGSESIQAAARIVQKAEFSAGVEHLAKEKGVKVGMTDDEILKQLNQELEEVRNCYAVNEREERIGRILRLIERLSDVDCALDGRTTLMMCAWAGTVSLINKLREMGADPTIKDGDGNPARHYASWAGNWKAEEAIHEIEREWNAAKETKDKPAAKKSGPKDKAILKEVSQEFKKWKERFANGGSAGPSDTIIEMLEKLSDVNATYYGRTALMMACDVPYAHLGAGDHHFEVVQYLVDERGADVNSVVPSGKSKGKAALDYSEDAISIWRYLRSYGAKRGKDVLAEAGNGTRG